MEPEQLKVLRLVAEGRISPAEGDQLLRILEAVAEVEPEPPPVEAIEAPPPDSPKPGRVRQWLSALGIGQLQNS